MNAKYILTIIIISRAQLSFATPTVNMNLSSLFQHIMTIGTSNHEHEIVKEVSAKPPSINWTTPYNPEFAEFAFDFASAAYAKNPKMCATKNNASIVKIDKIPCDYFRDECWVFIAQTKSFIVFSVRGTRTRLQLILELVETMSAPKKLFPSGGAVQHYFYTALQHIWDHGFGLELRKLRIVKWGHSLGGAISSLASTLFAYENADLSGFDSRKDVHLITFGQPRVGNKEYALAHDLLVPNSWRMVHRFDIVAHLPYCYEDIHRQCTTFLNHGPFHHGTEIWYPKTMNSTQSIYKICRGAPINEDKRCSNSYYIHYDINDHLFYFEKDVDFYGNNDCRANATMPPLVGLAPDIAPELSYSDEDTSNQTKKYWPRRHRKHNKRH